MNKKIISIMLVLFLMLVPVAIANAEETVKITVNSVLYTFDVSVDTSIETGLTLKLVPLTVVPDSDPVTYTEGAPIYMDECTTFVTNPANAELKRYTFDTFNVFSATPTGKYRVIVNGIYKKDFQYVKKSGKIAFYRSLAGLTEPEQWESCLQTGVTNEAVDFDLGGYFGYPAPVKQAINTSLNALPLTDFGPSPLDSEVIAFEELLKPEVARVLKVAELAVTPKAGFDALVDAYGADLGFDLTYYNDASLSLDPLAVCDRYQALTYTYDVAEVKKAFDLACLLAMIDTSDYGAVTEALVHYNGSCVSLNTALTTGFTPAEYNSLSNKLKLQAATLHTKTDIETAYTTAANEVIAARGQGNGFDAPREPGPSFTGSTTVPNMKPGTQTAMFSDLHEAAWAQTSIEALAKKGVLAGKGNGKFYPNDTVTREEFVKIIVEAIDIHEKDAKADFDDVESNRWSYSYIASAYRANIIQGTSDSAFSPAGQMSRQDMAVIMKRVADLLGIELTENKAKFADDASIASYAKEAVKALSGSGIINGVGDNKFSPKTTVTRAQAAKVVYELLVYGGMN